MRGAWGLGDPEVTEGARGAARLLGVVPVPARVTDVSPGSSWSWRVGGVDIHHLVRPRRAGSVITMEMRAPAPVEALLRVTYGPLVNRLVRRLARVAEC